MGPPKIAKLSYKWLNSMVYGRYNELVFMGFINQLMVGGTILYGCDWKCAWTCISHIPQVILHVPFHFHQKILEHYDNPLNFFGCSPNYWYTNWWFGGWGHCALDCPVDLLKHNCHGSFKRTEFGRRYLVGGLEHFLFSHILGIIIPID